VLDLNTRVLTSKTNVTIKRSDFEVTGDAMQFDTKTKNGRVEGRVRMLIYNLDE
jgi:lipopolysaccharide export system protein LptC